MAESERRRLDKERSAELKRELNEDQLMTLRGLEQFGWELKFIRRPPFKAKVAVVFDGDRKSYAVIEADGALNEKNELDIR